MKLKNLNEQSKAAQKRQEESDKRGNVAFRSRLAAQQFLKHHAPLLIPYIRNGGHPGRIAAPGVFEEKARQARHLAVAIAAKVLNKKDTEVTMAEARNFRVEAAEIIAEAWDGQIDIDLDLIATEIANAVSSADEVYDAETIKWASISGRGSASLTAAVAAASLSMVIELYNFRLGQSLVLTTLTSALMEATRLGVERMTTPDSTDEDRRSLSQTLMRTNSQILRTIYEAAAREALSELYEATEDEKKLWLRKNRPLETIIAKFQNWSHEICSVAAGAARETIANTKPSQASPSGH